MENSNPLRPRRLSRRRFLAATAGGLALAPGRLPAAGAATPAPAVLQVLVDTIVPADEGPGAVAVGVHDWLARDLAGDPRRARIYQAGLEQLDTLARERSGTEFAVLPLETRVELLLHLLGQPRREPAARLARLARQDVLERFYSSAPGQQLVGYPPPAAGYPDYALPPARLPDTGARES